MTKKEKYIEAAKIVSSVRTFFNKNAYCCIVLNDIQDINKFYGLFSPTEQEPATIGWWKISPHTPTIEKIQLARSIALLLMAEMEDAK